MTPRHLPDPDGPDSAALLRYVSDESPLPEAEAIRAWLAADPERQASIDELRAAWATPGASVPAWDRAGVWSVVADELRQGSAVSRGPRARIASRPLSRTKLYVAGLAAGVAVAFLGGAIWQRVTHTPVRAVTMAAREYRTTAGQRLALQLFDGTQVIVAPNSTLRIPADYGTARRDVSIDGAAYFDVAASADRPFAVYAGSREVRVLGTAFAVDGYRSDSTVTVTVKTGKVALSQVGVLSAGDVGSISASGRSAVRHGVNVESELAWTTGRLVFHDTPVPQLLAQLERWYDMQIGLEDSVARAQLVTITFDGDSRSEAVETLAKLLRMRPVWDSRGVQLVAPRGRSAAVTGE